MQNSGAKPVSCRVELECTLYTTKESRIRRAPSAKLQNYLWLTRSNPTNCRRRPLLAAGAVPGHRGRGPAASGRRPCRRGRLRRHRSRFGLAAGARRRRHPHPDRPRLRRALQSAAPGAVRRGRRAQSLPKAEAARRKIALFNSSVTVHAQDRRPDSGEYRRAAGSGRHRARRHRQLRNPLSAQRLRGAAGQAVDLRRRHRRLRRDHEHPARAGRAGDRLPGLHLPQAAQRAGGDLRHLRAFSRPP